MKKILSIVALAAISMGVGAQNLYEENLCRDNWSIGLDGGINTNLHRWDNGGGVLGLHIGKGITPVLSLEFSSQFGFSDMGWDGDADSWSLVGNDNHVSSVNVMGGAKVNLMNWWGGYNGQPRLFEIQARGGVGYLRYTDVKPHNSAVGKVGLDFDFNLGEKRAWTVSLRPAILWDVTKYANFEGVLDDPECLALCDRMAMEVSKVVNFYNFNNPEREVGIIFFLGGGARIAQLTNAISEAVSVPTATIEEVLPIEACGQENSPVCALAVAGVLEGESM